MDAPAAFFESGSNASRLCRISICVLNGSMDYSLKFKWQFCVPGDTQAILRIFELERRPFQNHAFLVHPPSADLAEEEDDFAGEFAGENVCGIDETNLTEKYKRDAIGVFRPRLTFFSPWCAAQMCEPGFVTQASVGPYEDVGGNARTKGAVGERELAGVFDSRD